MTPISSVHQQQVIDATHACIDRAATLFDFRLPYIPVLFDLRGRMAGMYRQRLGSCEIRYNPWIFARYFQSNLDETVPHEVAHYVVDTLFGRRGIKPHGNEWRKVMIAFGCEPKVTCNYDFSDLPQRQVKRFDYQCGCRSHQLTSYRHNRMVRGSQRYQCKQCGQLLRLAA